MKQILIAVAVGLAWIVLTAIAAYAVPNRGGDTQPDLTVDPHWQQRTPPNPVHYDRVRPGTQPATTTTAPRHTAPPPTVRVAAPRPRSSAVGVEQWRGLVASYGGWDVTLMLRIMGCESGGNAAAYNRSGATGLFQILGGPYDPAANVSVAHSMWSTRGTQPWNPSKACWG